MNATIDEMLDGLRGVPMDPRLETMDGAVMAGLAAPREKRAGRRGLFVTSIFALGVGLFASMVSPQGAQAEQAIALNAVPSSAPSSLLMGQR